MEPPPVPPTTPPAEPAPPTITVTFTPELGMHLSTSPNVQLAHLWTASAYLARVADQAHSDQHMAALAQSVNAKPSPLVIPRDHLAKRRI